MNARYLTAIALGGLTASAAVVVAAAVLTGLPGNGDSLVCGAEVDVQLTLFGLPVYNFVGNQLPA